MSTPRGGNGQAARAVAGGDTVPVKRDGHIEDRGVSAKGVRLGRNHRSIQVQT